MTEMGGLGGLTSCTLIVQSGCSIHEVFDKKEART